MKIAIIAPSPVPFLVGGAEKLWWGLQNHLNKNTAHQCELYKFPTRENSFWELIDSYCFYANLDLSHFDMIISTKYPCWMVPHPNHLVYMQHCLRGLYDTYHLANLPEEFNTDNQAVLELVSLMENYDLPLNDFFSALKALKNQPGLPPELFSFPGPFIRQIVHFLDQYGMGRVKRFLAISQTVSDRHQYFPPGTIAPVVYHPPNLTDYQSNAGRFFLAVSRLDEAKRTKLIIEAYMRTQTTLPLKIVGTGPQESELIQLAKDDQRIEFIGFISDTDLIDLYADAYAVIFVPYDEDYGLITIEAMKSRKPVLTCTDSGGVTEFVTDGQTGLVAEPTIENLAVNIERLAASPDLAEKLGKAAFERVRSITWPNCINALLNTSAAKTSKTKKITVVTTFPAYPPRGGGQNRTFYLCKELAKKFKIEIVALANQDDVKASREIAPNLVETRVPKSKSHAEKEWLIQEKVNIPVTDLAMMFHYQESPEFISAVKSSLLEADYLICSQPYLFPMLQSLTSEPIIYDSHNVEYLLKKQMLPDNQEAKELLTRLYEVEKEACLKSRVTTVCCLDDQRTLEELYSFRFDQVTEVKNGVDCGSVKFNSPEDRLKIKRQLGLENEKICLFIGSWHQPNLEAIEYILKWSTDLPDHKFIIVGSAGHYFANRKIPKNVGFMGVIDDQEKAMVLSVANLALCPMLSGSGTNLKMLDYLMAGVPVITTKLGARGLNLPQPAVIACDIDQFPENIRKVGQFSGSQLAYEYVKENFTWPTIAAQMIKIFWGRAPQP